MAAQSVGRTRTVLGIFYRRIKSRIGGKGAVTATAHKLALLIYRMLKHGTQYVAQALEVYEAKVKAIMMDSLRKKAESLGFALTPKVAGQPSSARPEEPAAQP
jgi:hypothetical protein